MIFKIANAFDICGNVYLTEYEICIYFDLYFLSAVVVVDIWEMNRIFNDYKTLENKCIVAVECDFMRLNNNSMQQQKDRMSFKSWLLNVYCMY